MDCPRISHEANTECISVLPYMCHISHPANTECISNIPYVCYMTHSANTMCISNCLYVYHVTIEANTFWLNYFTVKTESINLRSLRSISLYILLLFTLLYLQKNPHVLFSGLCNTLSPNERETGFRKYTKPVK